MPHEILLGVAIFLFVFLRVTILWPAVSQAWQELSGKGERKRFVVIMLGMVLGVCVTVIFIGRAYACFSHGQYVLAILFAVVAIVSFCLLAFSQIRMVRGLCILRRKNEEMASPDSRLKGEKRWKRVAVR